MQDILRFLTTAVIWLAYAGTVIASLLTGTRVDDWVIGLIVVVFGLLAAYATRKLWPSTVEAAGSTAVGQRSEKAKRDRLERVARLMEGLDDDDMVELESLLAVREQDLGM